LALVIFPTLAAAQYAPGRGSLGGSIGLPFLIATQEFKDGQKPRLIGKAHFQYVVAPVWRLSFRGAFGWVGFDSDTPAPFPFNNDGGGFDTTRIDQLTVLNPFSAALQYTKRNGSVQYFVGAGPGITKINVMNDRETIYDPSTFKRHSYWSWGVGGEGGAEYFLPANENVSFELAAALQYTLERNAEQFPNGYAGKHALFDVTFGVNVYFWPFGGPKPAPAAPPAETDAGAAPADTTTTPPGETPR
jgi:hypothetical protein